MDQELPLNAVPPAPLAPLPGAASESAELRSLRTTVHGMLVGLLVLTAGINIFMLRQVSIVQRQAGELRQFIVDYQTNQIPVMNKFVTELQGFARTHPDFAPVLLKYTRQPSRPPSLSTPPPLPKPIP